MIIERLKLKLVQRNKLTLLVFYFFKVFPLFALRLLLNLLLHSPVVMKFGYISSILFRRSVQFLYQARMRAIESKIICEETSD